MWSLNWAFMSEGCYPQVEEHVRDTMAGCLDASFVTDSPVPWPYHTPSLDWYYQYLSILLRRRRGSFRVTVIDVRKHGETRRSTAAPCLFVRRLEMSGNKGEFSALLLLQQLNQFTFNGADRISWGIPPNDSAIPIYQKLGEIPLNLAIGAKSWLLRLEIGKERVSIGAVHLNFGKQRECHCIRASAEGFNRRLIVWFLVELITRKTEHDKATIFVASVERLKIAVLGR